MPDPAELVYATHAGRTFLATRRTHAHLEWTIEQLAERYPKARLVIIQTCYNTGVKASAGTHDYDAVFDVQIVGLDWHGACAWLRQHGWAAWVREPPTFSWHIHMVSLGYVGQVGVYVPGQVRDYYDHRTGLAGHAPDPSWHPADIDSTIFDYPAWLAAQEDDMPYTEKQLEEIIARTVRAELDRAIDDADQGRVENPGKQGPKSMSQGRLLWAIFRLAQRINEKIGQAPTTIVGGGGAGGSAGPKS